MPLGGHGPRGLLPL